MLVLLPFLIIGLGVSAGVCSAAGFSGIWLAVMLLVLFAAAFAGALLLFALLLAVLSAFVNKDKPQPVPSRFFHGLTGYALGLITTLFRIRLHVSGTELLPEGRWLLVCNHRSSFDPIVTGWALRDKKLAFISKPENLQIPIAGQILHKAGYLPIDRENDRAALRTILAASERMKAGSVSYGIYPEGTRHAEEEMLPFRNGAFKIAQKAGTPIVIAAVRGTDDVKKNAPWRATDVYLDVCRVLDAETVCKAKTAEIGEEVRRCIISADT